MIKSFTQAFLRPTLYHTLFKIRIYCTVFICVTIPDPKWALKMLEISGAQLTTFRHIDQEFVDQHCLFVLCS